GVIENLRAERPRRVGLAARLGVRLDELKVEDAVARALQARGERRVFQQVGFRFLKRRLVRAERRHSDLVRPAAEYLGGHFIGIRSPGYSECQVARSDEQEGKGQQAERTSHDFPPRGLFQYLRPTGSFRAAVQLTQRRL